MIQIGTCPRCRQGVALTDRGIAPHASGRSGVRCPGIGMKPAAPDTAAADRAEEAAGLVLELAGVLQDRPTRPKVEATVRSWSRAQLEAAVVMATAALPPHRPVTELWPTGR
jgi:hypothetical protein